MKPVHIRRPLIQALKNLKVDVKKIPENMITHYVRRIKKILDEAVCGWLEGLLYKTKNLDILAKEFVERHVPKYAEKLKRELEKDLVV